MINGIEIHPKRLFSHDYTSHEHIRGKAAVFCSHFALVHVVAMRHWPPLLLFCVSVLVLGGCEAQTPSPCRLGFQRNGEGDRDT